MALVKQLSEEERLAALFDLEEETASSSASAVPDPRLSDPHSCPVSRHGRHTDWKSKKDGQFRCYYCCRVREDR